jgi:hypothetical protein
MAEPGRGLVAEAGVIVAEVMLVSRKDHDDLLRWVYLDIGKFSGLALAGRGRLVTAARLSGDGRLLASPAPGAAIAAADTAATANPVTGFFVIRAAGLAEAVEIARGCPHLAYGGEISVRPVARPGDGR